MLDGRTNQSRILKLGGNGGPQAPLMVNDLLNAVQASILRNILDGVFELRGTKCGALTTLPSMLH
eukprot:SAG31_NODE_730_length_12505_cov_3.807109_2_plen_65_part_00